MNVMRNSFLIWVIVIGAGLLVGGFGGSHVAKTVRAIQSERQGRERLQVQESVLKQMGTLNVGDTLQDHVFEDLNLQPVRLSSIVSTPTIISVFDPGCDACLEELATYQQILSPAALKRNVIFISGSNPRYMAELVASTGLVSHVLYDHHSAWLGSYRILTFPFNLVRDSDLVVRRIIVGQLEEDDLGSIGIEILQEA